MYRRKSKRQQAKGTRDGPTDQRKLDEYLGSIRQIEEQLTRAEREDARIEPHNLLTAVLGYAKLASQQLDPNSIMQIDLEEISGRRAAPNH